MACTVGLPPIAAGAGGISPAAEATTRRRRRAATARAILQDVIRSGSSAKASSQRNLNLDAAARLAVPTTTGTYVLSVCSWPS